VASLNAEAQAARVDATRLRTQAQALKLAVRRNLACSRERLEQALSETDRARARRDEPMPSPWSELRWTHRYETLEQTLVPLP
jgi:hypothetical protein